MPAVLRALIAASLLLASSQASAQTILSARRSTPRAGLELQQGDLRLTNGDVTSYDAAFTSLCTSYVHVESTAPATSLRTTGSWASAAGVQLAVNGDFYRSTGGTMHVYGDAVGGGRRWSAARTGNPYTGEWYHHDYGWIAFGPDWVEVSHTRYVRDHAADFGASQGWRPGPFTEEIPGGTRSLVSGFPEIVTEGRPYICPDPTGACFPDRSDMRDRHPRTAMGLSEDRRTFILLTIDGRNGRTAGALGVELASVMHQLGAFHAFNLDGGGSSSMWLEGSGYVNHLSDGSPRAVMNHWGVVAGSGSGGASEPGHCFTAGGCFPTRVAGAEGELFADLPPGSLGYREAAILFRAGITNGCRSTPERFFCPNCDIDRRQFVVMLIRAAGIAHPAVSSSSFSDVADDDWALPYIEAAAREGITLGCGGDRFCPGNPVTRGQAAAFLTRAAGWTAARPATPTFSDVPLDHLFFAAIETLDDKCVTHGCGGGRYCPERALNRAQTAVFLARAFDLEDENACLGEAPPAGPDAGAPIDAGGSTDPGSMRSDAGGPDPWSSDAGLPADPTVVPDGAARVPGDDGAVDTTRGRGSDPTGGAPMERGMTGGCQVVAAGEGGGWPSLPLLLIASGWVWVARRRWGDAG